MIFWLSLCSVIATASGDDSIHLYAKKSAADFELLLKQEAAHRSDVNCVSWSPKTVQPLELASCGDDKLIKIWRME